MSPAQKRKAVKHQRTPGRKQTPARAHYLLTDVTPEEKKAITRYCNEAGITINTFLRTLALEDAQRSAASEEETQTTITLTLSRETNTKLALFARMQEKSMDELIEELLQPRLKQRHISRTLKTDKLRFYLSDSEFATLSGYFQKRGLPAQTYVGMLAVNRIKQLKRRK